jgi:hypothetical protein
MQAIGSTRSQIRHEDLRSRADFDPQPAQAGASRKALSLSPSAQTLATPSVGSNVRVNAQQQASPNGLIGRSETTVASSADGQLIAVGFNNAQGFCGAPFGAACTPPQNPGLSGFAYSTDGGASFVDRGVGVLGNVFTRGDPWLDRGGRDSETFFYANLAVDATTGADLGVSVHRGHFAGSNFAFDDVHILGPTKPTDFLDKEAIAVAKDGSGLGVVSLTNFAETCNIPENGFGQIEVWRTHDGGDTWQGPVVVSPDQTFVTNPADPECGTGGIRQQSSVPAIGPNGEVYVAWSFGPTANPDGTSSTQALIKVARSLDGGVTFGAPVVAGEINSMRQNPLVGYNRNRINDHPRVAVATNGPHKGRVFLTYYSAVNTAEFPGNVACPAGLPAGATCVAQSLISSQAFLSFSDDQGLTWSDPRRIGPKVPEAGVKRLWPVVSVEPTGVVDLTYYESQEVAAADGSACTVRVNRTPLIFRTGSSHSFVNAFWVQSFDGGNTFTAPIAVSSVTSDWCATFSNVTPNFGDYIGSVSVDRRVLSTWADARNVLPNITPNHIADTFYATGFGS